MADTMIERMIAAINNSAVIKNIAGVPGGVQGNQFFLTVTNPEDVARAVLAAMREPTEAMVQAWFDAPLELPEGVPFDAPSSIVDPYHARSDWRAMIDAALAEDEK